MKPYISYLQHVSQPMKYCRRHACWLLTVVFVPLFLLGSSAFGLDVPAFKGYVNDYAGMLGPETEVKLEQALQSFELTDSTQVAVLTIDSLAGDALEDFSIRVVDTWKVGRKGKDNGVLLLAVKQERKLRIEVGRGLEGVLTDLLAGRIIDQVITPRFKAGQFDEGFEAGITAIIQATRGEYKAESGRRRTGSGQEPPPIVAYLMIGVFLIGFLGQLSKPLGVISGIILLPLVVFLGLAMPFSLVLLLFLLPIGAVSGLVLPLLFLSSMRHRGTGLHRSGGIGGGIGSGFGGGFSSGGFGGGGGGGFGGGGASGGW